MRFRERKIGGILKQGFVKRKILIDFFLQCVSASGAAQYISFVIVHRDCKNIVLYLCKGFRFCVKIIRLLAFIQNISDRRELVFHSFEIVVHRNRRLLYGLLRIHPCIAHKRTAVNRCKYGYA